MYRNEHRVPGSRLHACQHGGGAGIPAARDRAQLGNAERLCQIGIRQDILLAADQHDIAHSCTLFKGGQGMRQHRSAREREQQLVFSAHTPR